MKALTIHEPYASLVAGGHKIYETRSWSTRYRGTIAIHAGKQARDVKALLALMSHARVSMRCDVFRPHTFVHEVVESLFPCPPYYLSNKTPGMNVFNLGAVIAIGQLVAVHRVEDLTLTARERLFGNYQPGRYAWEIRQVIALETPVPVNGQQGLWNWTKDGGSDAL